jgi:hypothetical protein
MRATFLEFLIAEGTIPHSGLDQTRTSLPGAPEPIGSIAFSYGMVTGAEIDAILDEQRRVHRRFGEIAVDMGILTQDQVDTLVSVQQFRAVTEVAEALALSGFCGVDEMMARLGAFLVRVGDPAVR